MAYSSIAHFQYLVRMSLKPQERGLFPISLLTERQVSLHSVWATHFNLVRICLRFGMRRSRGRPLQPKLCHLQLWWSLSSHHSASFQISTRNSPGIGLPRWSPNVRLNSTAWLKTFKEVWSPIFFGIQEVRLSWCSHWLLWTVLVHF